MTATREVPHIDAWALLDAINTRDREHRERLAYHFLCVCSCVDHMASLVPDTARGDIECSATRAELASLREGILDRSQLGIRTEMSHITDRTSE